MTNNRPIFCSRIPTELLGLVITFTRRLNQSSTVLHVTAIVSILLYVLIYVNLATFLFPGAGHDDGLYISHAYSIASGHWLGPYSQFTFMKGPGYPLFLAALSLFRIPVPLAHSVLWGCSVWLLAYTTQRLFHSLALALIVLEVLLWHFGAHSMRILRDEIYTPQLLAVFSLLLLGLFTTRKAAVPLCALASGLLFGWFWMTREDAIVAVPALLFLFACSIHKARLSKHSIRETLQQLAGFAAPFATALVIVASINFIEYKAFTIVDITGPFEKTFEALESVEPTVATPYAAVSKATRYKVYRISPSFAQLGQLFDMPGSPLEGYKTAGCAFYPAICGDYANGWFVWAFRDAAALRGYYSSPRATATFYGHVRDEIARACTAHAVTCYHNVFPFLPHIEQSQLALLLPSIRSAVDKLSFVDPPSQDAANSIGSVEQVRAAADFLTTPYHTPQPQVSDLLLNRPVTAYATGIKNSVIRLYSLLLPPLLLLGILSTVMLLLHCFYRRSYSLEFAITCAAWLGATCRVALLVVIHISSFPAIHPLYIGYAYLLVCYASLLSLFLIGREFRQYIRPSLMPAGVLSDGTLVSGGNR